MTNRLLHKLVVVTLAASAIVAPHARAQAPAAAPPPGPESSQAPSPPAAQTPAPSSSQSPTAPADAVYAIGRDRVAPPRVQQEVKPGYTPEAMRNRIQGSVRLQGVVERDGTMSGITVVQSLDTQFGLDQAAINALKQWRFQPGTLADGTPVRVLVNVDLTFTLRDGPPAQGWPPGFADAVSSPGAVEERAESQGLRIRIARPAAWTLRTGPPSEWIGLHNADSSESVGVARPDTAAFDVSSATSDGQVQRLVEMMRRLTTSPQVETVATGRVQAAPGVLWVWSTFRVSDVTSVPGVPTGGPAGEARSWVFARTVNGKVVLVQCTLILPRNSDPAALPARLQQAAADFAPIIKSISVEAIAN
jgi:TonB family protein